MNYYYNMESWENGKMSILLIAGYSGSGKTTLGRELAKKYDCKVYEMDGLGKVLKEKLDKESFVKLKKDKRVWYEYMLQYVVDMHRKECGDKRFIIEGIRVPWFDMDKYKWYPMIIMGIGVVKSTFRACKRAFRKDYIEKYGLHLQVYFKFNWKYWLPVKRLKKFMDNRKRR